MGDYLLPRPMVTFERLYNGWRWIVKSPNGAELGVSLRFYSRKRDCKRAWNRMLRNSEYV